MFYMFVKNQMSGKVFIKVDTNHVMDILFDPVAKKNMRISKIC